MNNLTQLRSTSTMNMDVESLQQNLPHYLSAEDQKKLVSELNAINSGQEIDFILSDYNDKFKKEILQGDGWRGFYLFNFTSKKCISARGIVLSNSCDVDKQNKRDLPTRISFAPLVRLSAYYNILRKSKIPGKNIESKIESIKAQKTTNIFYIPKCKSLDEDYIIRLDDIHSMPTKNLLASKEIEKLFTFAAYKRI